MLKTRSPLRLHMFGKVLAKGYTLIIFAEFKESKVIDRHKITKSKADSLVDNIRKLQGFIEGGFPVVDNGFLTNLGSALFDLIIRKDVKRLFDQATGQRQDLLPLEIYVEDPSLTNWPWEYLFDVGAQKFLCQEFHPISRGLFNLYSRPEIPPVNGKIKILIVIGSAPEDAEMESKEHIKSVSNVFENGLPVENVEVNVIYPQTPLELEKEVQKSQFDIFHFFGHGGFDDTKNEGFLKLDPSNSKLGANSVAQMLANRGIRLVLLNACESGRSSNQVPATRSSIAAALIDRDIPAIVAMQFSLYEASAHYLSCMIYNGLLLHKTLSEAVRAGRRSMEYTEKNKFFDWGIPVLYTTDPNLVIVPKGDNQKNPDWQKAYELAIRGENVVKALGNLTSTNSPSLTVRKSSGIEERKSAKFRVAFVDLDAKVGFLPDLVKEANKVQSYYNFQVTYLPIPSSAIRNIFKIEEDKIIETTYPQLYMPVVEDYLETLPKDLDVNKVCCLTRCRIAGELSTGPFQDRRASALHSTEDVFAVSTYNLRKYSIQVSVSFAKSILFVCLAMIVATDERWGIQMHAETAGCLFDDCENRDDLMEGLKRMKFDHNHCRSKIEDIKQIKSIDALLALDF